ncbi:MAG TPA: SAM-dependent methyltransferase, partial [Blastocatellia bacterium]
MSFDAPTRNRLAKLVGEVRTLLTDEFFEQCRSVFGIAPSGEIAGMEHLGDLNDAERSTATLLRERVDYLVRTHPDEKGGAPEAVTQVVREQAFTVLNRLAALRMAEKRGLIAESVGKGYQSKGFKVFETVAGTGLGDTYHRYRQYLHCLFDELAVDLGPLFDRRSPQGVLFPREPVLLRCLAEINRSDLDGLWTEDETIGWVYQDYNDPAERKKMREAPAPRNSRELAVRNQFFTPRYVVEFLTDNTLGRIWYEMTGGKTRLNNSCRYLVQRPDEILSSPDASEQQAVTNREHEHLPEPSIQVPHRTIKDPREIRMLDPACGSMHFGLYAFDLFEVIYDEAWEIAHAGDAAEKSFPTLGSFVAFTARYADKETFLADVPRLIIEHNLHGIDIDPRAVQIAGLSLWLRAHRTWQQLGLHPQQRPRISRSNVVCAEPMPGDEAFLNEFIEAHLAGAPERRLLIQIVRRVFDAMKIAGEAGSLLKIDEEIAGVVAEAKRQWLAAPKAEQGRLFADDTVEPVQQALSFDVSAVSDSAFWERAEERIYTALEAYAEHAVAENSYQRRLFVNDAARGFAFIDLSRNRYDVILMNPPFGEASLGSREYLYKAIPEAARDLFAGFVSRFNCVLTDRGALGVLSNRTAFFSDFLVSWRKANFLGETARLSLVADLGYGVLDAVVEAAAYVCVNAPISECQFIDVLSSGDKEQGLAREVSAIRAGQPTKASIVRS